VLESRTTLYRGADAKSFPVSSCGGFERRTSISFVPSLGIYSYPALCAPGLNAPYSGLGYGGVDPLEALVLIRAVADRSLRRFVASH